MKWKLHKLASKEFLFHRADIIKYQLICFLITIMMPSAAKNTENNIDIIPSYRYRITLKDKNKCNFSIKHPEKFLSQKALERRQRQHISIDSTDLPVSIKYIKGIEKYGVKVIHTSKWNNTVCVSCIDTMTIMKIARLPYVIGVQRVAYYPNNIKHEDVKRHELLNEVKYLINKDCIGEYGYGYHQINLLNGIPLHKMGFRGEGMTIAILDAGYTNMDIIPMTKTIKIAGTHDFVNSYEDIFSTSDHGLKVVSCMGTNVPNVMIGTAPEANFWLLRTEDSAYEHLAEEDNWAAAVEFADSIGADVINSSLGYVTFDDSLTNVHYNDLNGTSHLMSREASMIADKGMILCNSIGNKGNKEWKRLIIPSDADNILSVGSVDSIGYVSKFSSRNIMHITHKIKPDVMAMGEHVSVVISNGEIFNSNGTSLSSPILCGLVACLWQALPNCSAKEIMDYVRKSGNHYNNPDENYGYGIPDFMKALSIANKKDKE